MTQAATLAQLASSGALSADTSGNVGIGTTSPTAKLSVAGDFYFLKGSSPLLATGDNTILRFGINQNEAMRIDTGGNVLVGTTTASAYGMRLRVVGGIESTNTVQFNAVGSAATPFEWVLRTGSGMDFYVNNAATKASLTSSGVWTNASDERYKENIKPIEYGISEVMQLQPRSYNMIGSDKQEIGFVAQEVQPFLPELVENSVNSITNEERMTLSYGQLSAVLVKAIQELKAELDVCKAEIAALKGV